MKHFRFFLTALLTAVLSVAVVSCEKDDKEPEPDPIPTPTPNPNPDPNPSASSSGCIFTDNSGQKFVLDKISWSEDEDDAYQFSYDTNGQLTTISAGDFLMKIDYQNGKVRYSEEGGSYECSFTMNMEGLISTYTDPEEGYTCRLEYSDGYLVRATEQYRDDDTSENITYTFKWANGSIENISEKKVDGDYTRTTEYEFLNTTPNQSRQYAFSFGEWLPEGGLFMFWQTGMLGKAVQTLPTAVYETSTSSYGSTFHVTKLSYVFDNLGRIQSETTTYVYDDGRENDEVSWFYKYRNWN